MADIHAPMKGGFRNHMRPGSSVFPGLALGTIQDTMYVQPVNCPYEGVVTWVRSGPGSIVPVRTGEKLYEIGAQRVSLVTKVEYRKKQNMDL